MAKHVTDDDFIKALEEAQRLMPDLFDMVDSGALQEVFENSIGTAMLNGSVSRYKPEQVEAGNWITFNGRPVYIRDDEEKETFKSVMSALKAARVENGNNLSLIHKVSKTALDRLANDPKVGEILKKGKRYQAGAQYTVELPHDTVRKNDKLNKNNAFLQREKLVAINDYDYEKIPAMFEDPDVIDIGKERKGDATIKLTKKFNSRLNLEASVSGKKGRFVIWRLVRKQK